MNIQELRAKLSTHRTVDICYNTGVSIPTVEAIKSGRNENPTVKTFMALAKYLENQKNVIPSSSN